MSPSLRGSMLPKYSPTWKGGSVSWCQIDSWDWARLVRDHGAVCLLRIPGAERRLMTREEGVRADPVLSFYKPGSDLYVVTNASGLRVGTPGIKAKLS